MIKPVVTMVLIGLLLRVVPAMALEVRQARPSAGATMVPPQIVAAPSQLKVLRRVITLDLDAVTLDEALQAIASRGNVRLIYNEAVVPLAKHVSLRVPEISVGDALKSVLQGTGVEPRVASTGEIALVRTEERRRHPSSSIVGRVTDAKTGRGLAGADVYLEETRWRTGADTAGWYRLVEVDTGSYALIVRRLGYAKQSRRVVVRAEHEDTVNIALEPAAVPLDELVTTATGQQRRRDIGNAVTTIHADSVMRTAPIRTLTDLLETRVPGLTVQHTSGAPGDPSKLRLRGLGSAFRSNDPVVVVDGIRIYADQSSARSGNLTNLDPGLVPGLPPGSLTARSTRANPVDVPAPSPLDQIDPNIIEKIEVLKGPSAATLYGADAANGVIVITTKRGRPGPTQWNISFTQARTDPRGQYPTGYYRWGHQFDTNDPPRFCVLLDVTCAPDSLVQFQALNNPALTVLGRGHRTGLSLTASGGAQGLTYSVTGTYSTETGLLRLPAFEAARFRTVFSREAPDWMQRPHQLQTWSVTSAVRAQLGSTASLTLSSSLARSEQQRTNLEQQVGPLAGTYVDTVNGLYYTPKPPSSTGFTYGLNSTSTILRDYYVRQTASAITVTTGLSGDWRPRSWFTASGQAGLNVIPRDDQALLPAGLLAATDSGALVQGTGRSLVGTFNLQGSVRKLLGRGFVFTTNVGANLTTTNTSDLVSSAAGLVPGTSSLAGARRINATQGKVSTSVFGWYLEPSIGGERLSLSTGFRLDGGSAYGTRLTHRGGGLFGLLGLPKLNGSWVISEEPWFPAGALISSLRLRGAYGQAQVQPGAADRLRLYTRSVDAGGQLLTLTGLGNTALKPERSTEFEGGFDADLLDSRVSLELTAYRKLQIDALLPIGIPLSVNGGGAVLTNIGNIRNTGLELTLGITPVRLPAVTWRAELLYSRTANTLVKLGDAVTPDKVAGLVEGFPLYSRWVRPILGFADQNQDGVIQQGEIQVGDSLVYMGRLYPAYTTQLHTDVALFGGAVGVSAGFSYDNGATQIDQTARTNWVLARALVDPSTPLGQQAAVVASTLGISSETRDVTDYGLMQVISTFRFNSFAVNYRAPTPVARLVRAQQLTVALQGSNLALHSTYNGRDPNVSAWSPGENIVDTGQLALPRTWQLAVYLQY